MKMKIFTIVVLLLFAASPALSDTYMITDTWGGAWADAEKSWSGDTQLCWATASSNILEYTGWGLVGGMTTTDDMFAHFRDHFDDDGGNSYYGWDWWWDGVDDMDGDLDWAQEDVDGGGEFYPTLNIDDYRRFSSEDSTALSTLDTWMHDGYGITISISGGMAHQITAWGYEYDAVSGDYTGIYVTDSDDSVDKLQLYGLSYTDPAGVLPLAWYMSGDSYGTGSTNYISEVVALQIVPVPGAVLLGILGLSVAGLKLRRFA